jgi:hypothetical protein
LGEAAAYRALARLQAAENRDLQSTVRRYLAEALRAGQARGSPRDAALTRMLSFELGAEVHTRVQVVAAIEELEHLGLRSRAEHAQRLLDSDP